MKWDVNVLNWDIFRINNEIWQDGCFQKVNFRSEQYLNNSNLENSGGKKHFKLELFETLLEKGAWT